MGRAPLRPGGALSDKKPQEDFPKTAVTGGVEEVWAGGAEALEFQRDLASWAKGPRGRSELGFGEGERISGRRDDSPTEGEAGEEGSAEAGTEAKKERRLDDSPSDFEAGLEPIAEAPLEAGRGGHAGNRVPKTERLDASAGATYRGGNTEGGGDVGGKREESKEA